MYTYYNSTTPAHTKNYSVYTQLFCLLVACFISLGTAKADVYTANKNGKFNDGNIWSPNYPGNVIGEDDTIMLEAHVELNTDLLVRGTLHVSEKASLTGKKNLAILPEGELVNQGLTLVEGINNQGIIYNQHTVETYVDFINTGIVANQNSMVVGNILENTGTLMGRGGRLMAVKTFVNKGSGTIKGDMDICSNNFMNIEGGKMDSVNTSFCGNKIFNSMFLTASYKADGILIDLKNSENKKFKQYHIERSTDGVNYNKVAMLTESDVKDTSKPFRYTDPNAVNSKSVYYRLQLTRLDGSTTTLPVVKVENF